VCVFCVDRKKDFMIPTPELGCEITTKNFDLLRPRIRYEFFPQCRQDRCGNVCACVETDIHNRERARRRQKEKEKGGSEEKFVVDKDNAEVKERLVW